MGPVALEPTTRGEKVRTRVFRRRADVRTSACFTVFLDDVGSLRECRQFLKAGGVGAEFLPHVLVRVFKESSGRDDSISQTNQKAEQSNPFRASATSRQTLALLGIGDPCPVIVHSLKRFFERELDRLLGRHPDPLNQLIQ